MPDNPFLAAALAAAERGWSVFPLVPGGKVPAVRSWEDRSTTDRRQIRHWWANNSTRNMGIATGPSNLLVVDLDAARVGRVGPADRAVDDGCSALARLAREAGEVVPADTFRVATPHGQHLYFLAPVGMGLRNSAGRLAPCVDIRAQGGYIVGPSSVVGGRRYRVACRLPPAPLPLWLLNMLRPVEVNNPTASNKQAVSSSRVAGYVDAAVRGEVRNIVAAAVGTRNHTLFVAAARIGGFVAAGMLAEDAARAALIGACAGHVGVEGFSQTEAERTVNSGLRHGHRRPRSLAASSSGARQPFTQSKAEGRARGAS